MPTKTKYYVQVRPSSVLLSLFDRSMFAAPFLSCLLTYLRQIWREDKNIAVTLRDKTGKRETSKILDPM